jgi:hypothetical protein
MKYFTNYINKIILSIIIIIYCLTFSLLVNASGFIFQWEPLFVDNDLALSNTGKKDFIKNSSIFDLKIPISDDYMDTFVLSKNHEGASTQKTENKSIPKINFSLAYGLMDNKSQIYSNSDDKQISNFINAITSLIYDDSKLKSLETIGSIIEPHINFYFEFLF